MERPVRQHRTERKEVPSRLRQPRLRQKRSRSRQKVGRRQRQNHSHKVEEMASRHRMRAAPSRRALHRPSRVRHRSHSQHLQQPSRRQPRRHSREEPRRRPRLHRSSSRQTMQLAPVEPRHIRGRTARPRTLHPEIPSPDLGAVLVEHSVRRGRREILRQDLEAHRGLVREHLRLRHRFRGLVDSNGSFIVTELSWKKKAIDKATGGLYDKKSKKP